MQSCGYKVTMASDSRFGLDLSQAAVEFVVALWRGRDDRVEILPGGELQEVG